VSACARLAALNFEGRDYGVGDGGLVAAGRKTAGRVLEEVWEHE